MPETSLSVEKAQRVAAFRAALRTFLGRTEEAARGCGLTPQRYLLLLMVKGAPDGSERLRLTHLAELLKLGRNTVTELVARAEEAGLVRREGVSGDRRVVLVALTAEGERRLGLAVDANEQHRRELAESFGALGSTFRAAER